MVKKVGRPSPVPSGHFTWYPDRREFAAYLSDFGSTAEGLTRGLPHPMGEIPNQKAPVVIIRSDKTGEEAVFALARKEVDREGDLQYYELRPTVPTLARHPKLKDVKLVLLND